MSDRRVVSSVMSIVFAALALGGCASTTQDTTLESPHGVAGYVPLHATAVPTVPADTHANQPYVALRRTSTRAISKHVGVKDGI